MLTTAIALLKRGEPLPLDLMVRLIEAGVDIQALAAKYEL